jgi:hypothetical protein
MINKTKIGNKLGQYGNYGIENNFKTLKDFKHHYITQIGPFIKLKKK